MRKGYISILLVCAPFVLLIDTAKAQDVFNMTSVSQVTTQGAMGWEPFVVGSTTYLIAANSQGNSKVFRWDAEKEELIDIPQALIETHNAQDWVTFRAGPNIYLAVANDENAHDSEVFRWDANNENPISVDHFTTRQAKDIEAFVIDSETYLAVANQVGESEVFRRPPHGIS